ncbi:MAG: methyltransferase domain-containing protein [Deltaproteobacteria bacterium]|nr:methyltransferase domain-containing protein [Deltaproteobacteria bacterium]
MDALDLLKKPEFPRSSRCDPGWMLDNQMGPNAIWLTEWLSEAMPLKAGMRVLDLGCGRAMSSIFLAKEYGVKVWAADLWMSPDHNWRRAVEAGVADLVCPVRAEAHALPFAQGFFDAVVSIDAYHYFGSDGLYLHYLAGFVRPGGVIGMAVPGLMQEVGDTAPPHLLAPQANGRVFWEDECWAFHSATWWRDLWRRSSRVRDVQADVLADGWRHWRDFERALELTGKSTFPSDVEALERDGGRIMGFVRAVAHRTEAAGFNYYDSSLGVQVGIDK